MKVSKIRQVCGSIWNWLGIKELKACNTRYCIICGRIIPCCEHAVRITVDTNNYYYCPIHGRHHVDKWEWQ